MNESTNILQQLSDLLEELANSLDGVSSLTDLFNSLSNLTSNIYALTALIVLIFAVVVPGIINLLISAVLFIVAAPPYYKLAKKSGLKQAWLAWIPIPFADRYIRTYLLNKIMGETPMTFFNRSFTLQNRFVVFWSYVCISLFGGAIITLIITVASFIPALGAMIGAITSLLYLVPPAIKCILDYAFVRDVLNMYKADKKSNAITAAILSVLDNFITFGFATPIYLYSILKCNQLPKEEQNPTPTYTYTKLY